MLWMKSIFWTANGHLTKCLRPGRNLIWPELGAAAVVLRSPDRASETHCDGGEMIRRLAPRFAPTRDGLFGGCRVFPCANISTYWAMRRARVSAFVASWIR